MNRERDFESRSRPSKDFFMSNGLQASRQALNFSSNVKKTSLGVSFTKKLFTNPESLSAKTITLVLKQLGLNIPKELELTNDVAQTIIAGGAVVDGLEAGKSLADLQSAVNVGAAGVRQLSYLGEQNGWGDADTMSTVRIGTSVAMLVATLGTDVTSWLALAGELANIAASSQGRADMNAIMDLQNQYKSRISPQSRILAETFKDFQEKNISIYGVIAKMAVETPDLWPQVINPQSPIAQNFPELMMLPIVNVNLTAKATVEKWGEWPWPASGRYVLARWESEKSTSFMTLDKKFDRESAARFFYELLLKPWMVAYSIANDEIVSRGNMSMANIAALTYLVKPDGEISDRYDYVSMLQGACLTPFDFGDRILEDIAKQFVQENYKGIDTSFHEQAVSFGLTESNKTFSVYQKDVDIMRIKLEQVQENDDISILTQFPYIDNKLQKYMDFEQVSFEKDPSVGGKINEKFTEKSVRAWRKLHNYFAVLQMLNAFRSDSYLSQTAYAQSLMPFMPTIDQFDAIVQHINYLSTMRSANRLALANIAKILGVKNKNLKRLTGPNDMGATKFKLV